MHKIRSQTSKILSSSRAAKRITPPTRCAGSTPATVDTTPAPAYDCVKFEDVVRATRRINGGVRRTNCERSHWLSLATSTSLHLKHEQTQFTGSFKERGARNALLELSAEERKRGVMAASAGNHALALSWHGQQLGIPVTVAMPTVAPMAKVEKCRKFGANIVITGANIGEAKNHLLSSDEYDGIRYINGYDDVEIVAGAGSMGIEIVEQVPNVEVVVVPVGGAGLIAGVALAVKTMLPNVRVIGVEPYRCKSYTDALEAGRPVQAHTTFTLADGLAVPTVGPHAFEVARHWVDEVVHVNERDISLAMLRLVEGEKVIVEGGGAAGIAAMLPGGPLDRPDMKGKTVVAPLCGGNIDTTTLGRVLERGLSADGRLIQVKAAISDRPGGVSEFTRIVASLGGSIKDVFHERAWLYSSIDEVVLKVVVETAGHEHNDRLLTELRKFYPGADMVE